MAGRRPVRLRHAAAHGTVSEKKNDRPGQHQQVEIDPVPLPEALPQGPDGIKNKGEKEQGCCQTRLTAQIFKAFQKGRWAAASEAVLQLESEGDPVMLPVPEDNG